MGRMRRVRSGYVLQDLVGVGANGEVWVARAIPDEPGEPAIPDEPEPGEGDAEGPDLVALKILHPALARDPVTVERFWRSAPDVTALRSPGLVTVREFLTDPPAIAMELVDGPDLQAWRARYGPPDTPTLLDLADDLLTGLGAVHAAGLLHLDLKPENVLVPTDPDGRFRARITDVTMGAVGLGPSTTPGGRLIGSPTYLAPERARGEDPSPSVDLYAAGCLLYELLTGVAPFTAPTAAETLRRHVEDRPEPIEGLAPELWRALVALLAKDPGDRPRTAAEAARLWREAGAATENLPDTAPPAAPRENTAPDEPPDWEPPGLTPRHANPGPPDRPSRRRVLLVAAVTLPVVLVGGLVAALAPAGGRGDAAGAPAAAPGTATAVAATGPTSPTTGATGGTAATSSAGGPGPWGGLQALADTWSSVVPARPGSVGDRGQICQERPVISAYSVAKVLCRFPEGPTLVVLGFASSADREKRIAVERARPSARVSGFRIAADPALVSGTRILLTGGDRRSGPWLWWAYAGQERYALFSGWDGHSLEELQRWWSSAPSL